MCNTRSFLSGLRDQYVVGERRSWPELIGLNWEHDAPAMDSIEAIKVPIEVPILRCVNRLFIEKLSSSTSCKRVQDIGNRLAYACNQLMGQLVRWSRNKQESERQRSLPPPQNQQLPQQLQHPLQQLQQILLPEVQPQPEQQPQQQFQTESQQFQIEYHHEPRPSQIEIEDVSTLTTTSQILDQIHRSNFGPSDCQFSGRVESLGFGLCQIWNICVVIGCSIQAIDTHDPSKTRLWILTLIDLIDLIIWHWINWRMSRAPRKKMTTTILTQIASLIVSPAVLILDESLMSTSTIFALLARATTIIWCVTVTLRHLYLTLAIQRSTHDAQSCWWPKILEKNLEQSVAVSYILWLTSLAIWLLAKLELEYEQSLATSQQSGDQSANEWTRAGAQICLLFQFIALYGAYNCLDTLEIIHRTQK